MEAKRNVIETTRTVVVQEEQTVTIPDRVTLKLTDDEAKDLITFFGNLNENSSGMMTGSRLYESLFKAGIEAYDKNHPLARHATGLHNAFHDLRHTAAWEKYSAPSKY